MRRDARRLAEILEAIDAIGSYLASGTLDDGIVFDAVRMRFVEIGEAVKSLDPALLAAEPDIPWRDVARMRDHLTHRYFDTARATLQATAEEDLPPLAAAARRLLARLAE